MAVTPSDDSRRAEWSRWARIGGPPRRMHVGPHLGWLCNAWPGLPEVHVVPIADQVEHVPEGCPCGPRVEAVFRADGSNGWLVVHHSLDGRERFEVAP